MVVDYNKMKKDLGGDETTGPMRFAPSKEERTIEEQMNALTDDQKECITKLKSTWEKDGKTKQQEPFSDEMYLRFARNSPGSYKFNYKTAYKVMKKYNRTKYEHMKATDLEHQLLTKTLFPIPNITTKEGNHEIFYMRPSRYFPKQTSTEQIIDNLAYCMSCMLDRSEKSETEGIGFVAYMNDWHMCNFSIDYCFQFMLMLQGRIPVRVRLFLIVNPPSWFDKIWKIMKLVLASDFRQKVKMIPESDLHLYLNDNYEQYLPDDMECGKANTQDMVQDFITYRKYIEK